MTEAEAIKVITAAKLDGRALVVLRAPSGVVRVKGAEVPAAAIAQKVADQIRRELPGVCAVVLPAEPAFSVEVYAPEVRA